MDSNWQLEAQITEGESLGNPLCTIMSGRQRVDAIGGVAGQTILRPFLVKWISKDWKPGSANIRLSRVHVLFTII